MSNTKDTNDGFKVPSLPRSNKTTTNEFPPLKYTIPENAKLPTSVYKFDVIKDGTLLETLDIPKDKSYFTFGRLPICDFPMDHPSISRYHAVLQFTADGVYICDLSSSHGTFVNKQYVKGKLDVRVGDQIRFGVSSRIWVLGSTEQDDEQQDNSNTDYLNESVSTQVLVLDQDGEVSTGWTRNPHAGYLKDPVKYLKELLMEVDHAYSPKQSTSKDNGETPTEDDEGFSKQSKPHVYLSIELPFTDNSGTTLYGNGHAVDKKEAERLLCLDALDQLDKHGYLTTQTAKQTQHQVENYSDDDDDESFYDCTNKKPQNNVVETFETLSQKLQVVESEMSSLKDELDQGDSYKDNKADVDEELDELDVYMGRLDREEKNARKNKMVVRIKELENEKQRLKELLRIVAPDDQHQGIEETNQVVVKNTKHQNEKPENSNTIVPPALIQAKDVEPTTSISKHRVEETSTNTESNDHAKTKSSAASQANAKKRPVYGPTIKGSDAEPVAKKAKADKQTVEDDDEMPWQPPAGQTGDGRTSLNEKFGY